jgi:aspartate/methionine/tyrosine aminotransferase
VRIADFALEQWLNPRDATATYNLGASCVKALHFAELFELVGQDPDAFYRSEVRDLSLHYGDFFGLPRLRAAIAALYRDADAATVLTVHGGTGANNLVITELLEPEDNVVALVPNYQQHYAIPEALGAEVRHLRLRESADYLPDMAELATLVDARTRLITLSNPNNPTGAFIDEAGLRAIADAAPNAWILSDEIYRGLDEAYMPSIIDVTDRGIATSSLSKVFSLAGTRVGWIVTKDADLHARLENRRSYDTICCGPFDELVAAIAVENQTTILARSRDIVGPGRAILDEWLLTQPRLRTTARSWSTTALVSYEYDLGAQDLCRGVFEDTGVLLCHGDCFDMPGTFRLGYGFGDNEHLRAGLDVLGTYLDGVR